MAHYASRRAITGEVVRTEDATAADPLIHAATAGRLQENAAVSGRLSSHESCIPTGIVVAVMRT